jgi:hypothetical protein
MKSKTSHPGFENFTAGKRIPVLYFIDKCFQNVFDKTREENFLPWPVMIEQCGKISGS